ncbi:hypothetical protein DITRI_Ditri14bG0107200 [Diplodiscus trichospermus]
MATASKSRLLLLFMIIALMLLMRNSEARSSHGVPPMAEKIDSRTILEKLGYDVSKITYYRRILGGDPERIPPDGPDPQHHH